MKLSFVPSWFINIEYLVLLLLISFKFILSELLSLFNSFGFVIILFLFAPNVNSFNSSFIIL